MRPTRAFTLIELVAVIVILAVLGAVAAPRFFDHTDKANESADEASLAAIRTALNARHVDNRLRDAPSTQWIDSLTDLAGVMQGGELPKGLTIQNNRLVDRRGNEYQLSAETGSQPARLEAALQSQSANGADLPGALLVAFAMPWLLSRRRSA